MWIITCQPLANMGTAAAILRRILVECRPFAERKMRELVLLMLWEPSALYVAMEDLLIVSSISSGLMSPYYLSLRVRTRGRGGGSCRR